MHTATPTTSAPPRPPVTCDLRCAVPSTVRCESVPFTSMRATKPNTLRSRTVATPPSCTCSAISYWPGGFVCRCARSNSTLSSAPAPTTRTHAACDRPSTLSVNAPPRTGRLAPARTSMHTADCVWNVSSLISSYSVPPLSLSDTHSAPSRRLLAIVAGSASTNARSLVHRSHAAHTAGAHADGADADAVADAHSTSAASTPSTSTTLWRAAAFLVAAPFAQRRWRVRCLPSRRHAAVRASSSAKPTTVTTTPTTVTTVSTSRRDCTPRTAVVCCSC
mmetsp:Transcript_50358/g.123805  ORF Transcript_50358/g.123805 Transcript_50358/m.123805 type:complete len:277 (+) Transcript_50358:340-1170(+)